MKDNKLKKVCVFTCCGIGDFVWATSAISLIKNYNENINLTLITFDSYKSIIDEKLKTDNILFTSYQYFFHSNKLIRYLYKFYWLIKLYFHLHKIDMLICLDNHFLFTKFAKYICRIKEIVGANTLKFGYNTPNKDAVYYTKQIIMPKDGDRNHCMMRYQQIIRTIFPNYNLSIPILPNTDNLSDKIKGNFLTGTKKHKIALCTIGTSVRRTLPIDYTVKLVQELKQIKDVTFFIVGNTKEQKKEADYLKIKMPNMDIKNVCCKTTLLELKELLKNMDLLISVDTGVVHLAATNNIPTISFYGISLPEQAMPISPNARTFYSKLSCVPCFYNAEINRQVCENPKCLTDVDIKLIIKEVKGILK